MPTTLKVEDDREYMVPRPGPLGQLIEIALRNVPCVRWAEGKYILGLYMSFVHCITEFLY